MPDQPHGTVMAIHISAEAGMLLKPVEKVFAQAGRGIVGDRYSAGAGTWSNRPGGGRHLTLIAQEDLDAVARDTGIQLTAAASRRNVLTTGVDLTTLIGKQFRVGSTLCIGVRACDPCAYLEGRTQRGVLNALVGRGGLRAEILESGEIVVGDAVREVEPASV